MMRDLNQRFLIVSLLAMLAQVTSAWAHHFKGLPHYNYFENYPQVPEEEFLGRVGDYEVSLVVYDFQGIDREKVEEPESVRLFLVIFNLRTNAVYGGRLHLEILDRDRVVHEETQVSSQLENLYAMHRQLPEDGRYSLRLTLRDENDLQCRIPFVLSSQKIHWGKWIGLALGLLVIVAAVGARRARVRLDRQAASDKRRRSQRTETVLSP